MARIILLPWGMKLILIPVLLLIFNLAQAAYIFSKAHLGQYLLNSAWQESQLTSEQGAKPWWWADFYPVAKLTIQKISLSTIVANNDSGEALAFAPGLKIHNGSEIISGHIDTHFSHLNSLEEGDLITYQKLKGKSENFKVINKIIIDTRQQALQVYDTKSLFLVTCFVVENSLINDIETPYRLVVEAQPV